MGRRRKLTYRVELTYEGLNTDLEDRLDLFGTRLNGEFVGSGTVLATAERDLSFMFATEDNAREFLRRVSRMRTVEKIELPDAIQIEL